MKNTKKIVNEASLFCFVEKVGEIELEGVNEQKRRREKVVEKELEREREGSAGSSSRSTSNNNTRGRLFEPLFSNLLVLVCYKSWNRLDLCCPVCQASMSVTANNFLFIIDQHGTFQGPRRAR